MRHINIDDILQAYGPSLTKKEARAYGLDSLTRSIQELIDSEEGDEIDDAEDVATAILMWAETPDRVKEGEIMSTKWYRAVHQSGEYIHRDADLVRDGGWRLTKNRDDALGSYSPDDLPTTDGSMPPFERVTLEEE